MRSPVVWLSACSCALAIAGCGGEETRPQRPPPSLPAVLAERLARDAEEVAARMDAADPCGAAAAAARLRTRALEAVNGPAVPAALKEELLSNAQTLHDEAARACAAAPPAATTTVRDEEDEDGGEDQGRGRNRNGKGKGKGTRGGEGDG